MLFEVVDIFTSDFKCYDFSPSCSANSELHDAPYGMPVSQSCNDNQVVVEETRLLVVQEVSTMSSEPIDREKCPIGVSVDHLQNSLPMSDEDAAFRQVINGFSPLPEPLAQKTLQEQLESVGLVTEEDQVIKWFLSL